MQPRLARASHVCHRILHSTVEDPPQVTERDRRGQHSPIALAGGEAALSERTPPPTPHVSPTGRPATMAAAAGLSRRCTVRGQVDLSPSENNRLRVVLVIACPCPLAAIA